MIVLISGVNVSIGAAVTKRFAQHGHRVIAVGRDSDRLHALTLEFDENVIPMILEEPVSRNSIRAALMALPREWRNIDVLINNASLSLGDHLAHEASLEDWLTMIDANCKRLVAMTLEILPGMLERHAGTILNLSSARDESSGKGRNVYGATVAFVHQYTLSLIESLANTGVRATCIAPDRSKRAESLNLSRQDTQGESMHEESAFNPTDAEIADVVYSIATLPPHVDINRLELAQTGELFSPLMLGPGTPQ